MIFGSRALLAPLRIVLLAQLPQTAKFRASTGRTQRLFYQTIPDVVPGGAFLLSRPSQIVALAARNSIPAIYADREYVAAGGLLSYGPIQTEAYRGAGIYVSKILKGAKPAELPIDESAKFEFVFNLKAARALGIELPLSLMMQVSETIE